MESLSVTLLQVLAQTLQIYSLVLIVRVLLSWFPNLDWGNPVLSSVSAITDPYLNAFRGLIPPLGGIDNSFFLISAQRGIDPPWSVCSGPGAPRAGFRADGARR